LSDIKSAPFYGSRLKVHRAEHHINDLEAIFNGYAIENVHGVRRKTHRDRGIDPGTRLGGDLPHFVPAILGDAVHNLRVALDYAYVALTRKNFGSVNDYTRFPFMQDRQTLVGTINGHKVKRKTPIPSDTVVKIIAEDIQPYVNGKLSLYELHRLDITDKHVILIPTQRVLKIDRLDVLDQHGRPTGGGISGISFILSNQSDTNMSVVGFAGGASGILHGNPKDAVLVIFDKGQPFEDKGVIDTLRMLTKNVTVALDLLEPEAR
jgi:hypothetical protein